MPSVVVVVNQNSVAIRIPVEPVVEIGVVIVGRATVGENILAENRNAEHDAAEAVTSAGFNACARLHPCANVVKGNRAIFVA